jgi:hypothetical protein
MDEAEPDGSAFLGNPFGIWKAEDGSQKAQCFLEMDEAEPGGISIPWKSVRDLEGRRRKSEDPVLLGMDEVDPDGSAFLEIRSGVDQETDLLAERSV